MPEPLIAALHARGLRVPPLADPARRAGPVVRLVASFATLPEEVDALVAAAAATRPLRARIALVDEAGEERQRRRLAVLTAPGPRAAQAAILPLQVERDPGLDPRRPRRRRRPGARRQPLVPPQLEAALNLGRQQPAGLDQEMS